MTGRGGRRASFARGGTRSTNVTGILTLEEKQALIALISDVTGKMNLQIFRKFETTPAPVPAENRQRTLLTRTNTAKLVNTPTPNTTAPSTTASNKENNPPTTTKPPQGQGGPLLYSKAHEALSKPETRTTGDPGGGREHDTPATTGTTMHPELKRELQAVFQKWQNLVNMRIKDLSVQQPEASAPAHATRGGRGGRGARGGRGGRGNRGDFVPARGQSHTAGAPAQEAVRGRGGPPIARGAGRTLTPTLADPYLASRFPPVNTWLKTLPLEKRKLLLHLAMLSIISLDVYSSFSRILLLYVTSSLHLPMKSIQEDERRLARGLGQAVDQLDLEYVIQQRTTESKKSRKWKAAGASLIGTVGTLPKSLASAGLGSVPGGQNIGAALAARIMGNVAHNGIVVGNILGVYAGRETGKMIDQYAKDSTDFAFLPIQGNGEKPYRDSRSIKATDRRMRLVIGVGGWVTPERGPVEPFRCLASPSAEGFALRYELENLKILGIALETIIFKSALWRTVKQDIGDRTVLSCLMDRDWPIGLVRLSKMIDNPWCIAMSRCERAGLSLAECIGRKVQGDRPVNLVGYGLGARAIYICLMTLAERRQFGFVESAILIGAPAPADQRLWLNMKSVVVGRMVNVYSQLDLLLGFLSRHNNLEHGIAGLQSIQSVEGVENFNASNLITGHVRYQYEIGRILKTIGWEDLDLAQVVEDEVLLTKKDKKVHRKKAPAPPHLPVDKDLKPVPKPPKKKENGDVNSLDALMSKMKMQS